MLGLSRAFDHYKAGRFHDALATAEDAIASIGPTDRQTLAKLRQLRGVIFAQPLNDNSQALTELSAALDAAPEDEEIRNGLIWCCSRAHDWDRVADLARPLLDAENVATARIAHETLIQALIVGSSPTTASYRDHVANWSRRFIQPIRAQAPPPPTRALDGRPLRIGLVYRSFSNRRHDSVTLALFEEMRRCGAWIAAVSTVPPDEHVPPEVRNSFDHWLNIGSKEPTTAVLLVSALSLDVLLNLDGFTSATQFDLFARQPATLLVSWHNTFYTFGAGLFDCILADKVALSDEERREYAEDIIDVSPCPFTFTPPDDAPPVAPSPVLETGVITFGTMNRPSKISSQTMESWQRILGAVPGSWLFLRNSFYESPVVVDQVRRKLVATGISSDRIVFAGRADPQQFLESYALIDIALDCFPFTGGGTTVQALWQGVPVVTFAGERWVARLSASTLEACGLSELIAPNQRGFEALAVSLARDVPRLVRLRSSIRDRVAQSRLIDTQGLARQLLTKLRERVEAKLADKS